MISRAEARGAVLAGLMLLCQPVFSQDATSRFIEHEGPLILRNITVIDGLGHPPAPMRDVLIAKGRIERIAVSGTLGALPPGSREIDGDGLTVLPGLIDAHVHIGIVAFKPGAEGEATLEEMQTGLWAHLYSGVTSVLDMGGDMTQSVGLRDDIASKSRVGPDIHTVGEEIHALNSPSTVFDLTSPEVQAEIQALLDERAAAGIDIIKIYNGVTPWEARHIMTEARKRGMRGIADFWCTNLSRTVFEVSLIDAYAHGGCRKLTAEEAEWMAANDKFAILTLTLFETMGGQRAFSDYRDRSMLENPLVVDVLGKQVVKGYYEAFPVIRETFEEGEDSLYNAQLFPNLQRLLPDNQANAALLFQAGVIVGMGTDAAFPPGTWPGEAMHRELELHVAAGIPPVAAIQMATHNNAVLLRRDQEIGSVRAGWVADLLVVEGNPADDISHTRNIRHVIKDGRLIRREALRATRN